MKHFSKTIGIIGGAGPVASAFLYSSILRICQKQYHANDYCDFPEIVLISYPFTRGQKEQIQQQLASCFERMKLLSAELVCIASHSFHALLPDLPKGFVHLVKEGLAEAARQQISKALIFAAPFTIASKLYEQSNIQCIYPEEQDQQIVNSIIREIAGGRIASDQSERLQAILLRTRSKQPIDGIILACTELPLAHAKTPISTELLVIDTMQILAQRLVSLAHSAT